MEEQARGVLSYILDSVSGWFIDDQTLTEDPKACPNCGTPTDSQRTPYCECRETAAFVRQFRSSLSNGAIRNPDRQVALGQKLWRPLGGGLPLHRSLAPERAVAQVMRRAGGKCELCGAPAIDVDHTGGG